MKTRATAKGLNLEDEVITEAQFVVFEKSCFLKC